MSQEQDDKILELARRRFRQGQQALKDQLARELEDLTFEFEPWTDEAIKQRSGGVIGNIALPPRPMLKIPTLDQPLQLVENQEKAAHLEPQIHPEGEDASDKTAEVLQSIYRDIETKSRAHIARDWAFRRKIRCGRGWWRVNKVWADEVDEGPGVFDQKITIDRILNQASVTPDPSAQQPDWSDGGWLFCGGFQPIENINIEYDVDISASDFEGLGDATPQWFTEDDGVKMCRITEYFCVEQTKREIVIGGKTRSKPTKKIMYYKIVAHKILERQEWDGPDIPFIPDVGRESNINGKRRWEGIISKSKDAVRLVNWTATTAVEKMAAGMISPLIMYEGQQEGHEAELAQANTRMFPYMLIRPTLGPNGELLPPPQRNLQGPDLQSDILMLQQAKEFVSAATFVYDPGKGQPDSHRSGKAVQALQNQMDEGNSNYLDDFAQIAVTREAQIVLGLIPKVYDRPGRLVQILGKDDEISQVILNAPFVKGDDGRPQVVPEGTKDALHYDLAKGRYAVTVSVGKSYQTRRQQGADQLGQLIGNIPQTFPILGWRYVGNLDFPGAKEASNDLKMLIPKEIKEKDNQQDPQQLQQELMQASQQIQQMQEVIVKQQHALETKQVEAQAKAQVSAQDNQAKMQLANLEADKELALQVMKNAATIAVAHITAASKGAALDAHAMEEAQALGHEAEQADLARQHEAQQTKAAQQHEVAIGEADTGAEQDQAEQGHRYALEQGEQAHGQALEQGEQGHAQALEQTEQAAALAPEPAGE